MLRIVKVLSALTLLVAATIVASPTPASSARVLLQGFPLLKQQHSLTCESSAVSMATLGKVSEAQMMGTLPRDPNPNRGFRGNPDGEQGTKLIDYGVYAAPLQKALLEYGYRSYLISYGTDLDIRSYVDRGWPVVVWVTYALQRATPRLAWAGTEQFFLVPHEHVILVTGYDDASIIGNDPWTAKQVRYGWGNFNRAWGYFADMGLAVEPCPMPQPVSHLRPTALSSAGITWSWSAAPHASQYHVRVVQHGPVHTLIVDDTTQSATSLTLPDPAPNVSYEISVTSISPCGGLSDTHRLWTVMPETLAPTPSPSPTASTTLPVTGTPSTVVVNPIASPTATATATPSATPSKS